MTFFHPPPLTLQPPRCHQLIRMEKSPKKAFLSRGECRPRPIGSPETVSVPAAAAINSVHRLSWSLISACDLSCLQTTEHLVIYELVLQLNFIIRRPDRRSHPKVIENMLTATFIANPHAFSPDFQYLLTHMAS